jgi:bifunctional DNA-binding transcriptional regulator/antitoxin component of YhaV-PrlF toxin-antitoxin module
MPAERVADQRAKRSRTRNRKLRARRVSPYELAEKMKLIGAQRNAPAAGEDHSRYFRESRVRATLKTAKISSRGQITLPRDARKALGTDYVRIVSEQGSMRIEPLEDVGSSLAHYAKGRKRVPFQVEREQAWEAHVRDKFKLKRR